MNLLHLGLIAALFCTLALASAGLENKVGRRSAAISSTKLKPAIYVKQLNRKQRHIATY